MSQSIPPMVMYNAHPTVILHLIPLCYWNFAFDMTNFLINQTPTSQLHMKYPFEILFKKPLDPHFLQVFSCLCYPWIKLVLKINLIHSRIHVFSWFIVKFIKGIGVLIRSCQNSMSFVIYCLMNRFFLSKMTN